MDAAQLRPLRIGEVLDLGIKIYRGRFSDMVKASAAILVPVSVLGAVLQVSSLPASIDSTTTPDGTLTIDGGELAIFLVAAGLGVILSFIGSQLATAATIKIVSSEYLDEPTDWRASLEVARTRLGSLVWLGILLVVLLSLGVLACVIPAIYFYGAWAVAVPVLVIEDLRGRKALKRSRQLVRDRWWPTMGVIVISAILTFLVQSILSGALIAIVAVAGNDVVDIIAQGVASAASSILIGPFSATVIAVVYFDLRVRKEGFDLELLARRLGTPDPS